ncbi:hypothetical protein [Bosea sp. (in: a-proteobacteria)]|uniref:hypothetical protein n=1 Tax=Bosea sp. (in: a-proteobacteria) TaxID=1871050 RepID=UPI0011FCE121|nr:hypothetical protein [Bosea sp. (in: a-proteobacteria)]TAJ30410.1 MAG: hypothetical protein EPO59_11805 [Bosea sp. (in: a-proteobacteria)]
MANGAIDSLSEARRIEALRAQQALANQAWEEQIRAEEAAEAERKKSLGLSKPEKSFSEGPITWLFKKMLSLISIISPLILSFYMLLNINLDEKGVIYVVIFWVLGICAIPFAVAINFVENSIDRAQASIRTRTALTERFSAIYGLKIFISFFILSITSLAYYYITEDKTIFFCILVFMAVFGGNYIIMNYRKNKALLGSNFEEAEELVDFLYSINKDNERSGINRMNPAYIERSSSTTIYDAVYGGKRVYVLRR